MNNTIEIVDIPQFLTQHKKEDKDIHSDSLNMQDKAYNEIQLFFSSLQKDFSFQVDEESILNMYNLLIDNFPLYTKIKESLNIHQLFFFPSEIRLEKPRLNLNSYLHELIQNPNTTLAKFESSQLQEAMEILKINFKEMKEEGIEVEHQTKINTIQNFLDKSLNKLHAPTTVEYLKNIIDAQGKFDSKIALAQKKMDAETLNKVIDESIPLRLNILRALDLQEFIPIVEDVTKVKQAENVQYEKELIKRESLAKSKSSNQLLTFDDIKKNTDHRKLSILTVQEWDKIVNHMLTLDNEIGSFLSFNKDRKSTKINGLLKILNMSLNKSSNIEDNSIEIRKELANNIKTISTLSPELRQGMFSTRTKDILDSILKTLESDVVSTTNSLSSQKNNPG